MQLTWADLFHEGSEVDFPSLFAQWPGLIEGPIQPIGMSAFGDLYFRRPDGTVHVLDLLEGGIRQVAASDADFRANMNSRAWQDANLMPEVVALLRERGLQPGPGQVYGFAPHPALVGKLDFKTAVVLDAVVWHTLCRQILGTASSS